MSNVVRLPVAGPAADYYCERDTATGATKRCEKQCAACANISAQAVIEDELLDPDTAWPFPRKDA